ncbi:MAG: enoyl-CoA hydratase [Alphaproteobacteria bacterium]|nr:enoyl-CoA hydratase [Alphaproteobacteria bacterium]
MSLAVETSAETYVLREDRYGVAWLTLNRPHAYNALSVELIAAMQESLNAIAVDSSVKVVVLRGAGKGFCAGHDLKQMQANRSEAYYKSVFASCSKMMMSLMELPQPVIGCVHGIATAAGLQLLASCDLAVAEKNTRFGTPGVNIGLFCSTPMVAVSRKVQRKKMMEMLLTGEMLDTSAALDQGLINKAVPTDQLESVVSELAAKIVAKSPAVVKIGKQAFYKQLEMPLADAYAFTSQVMTQNMMIDDATEGMSAFTEKRAPVWKGK